MFRKVLIGAVLLGLTSSPSQSADDVGDSLEQFYRYCLAERAPFDRMRLTADDKDWEPIAEPALAELAPIGRPSATRVWIVEKAETGLPAGTIIGVTKARMDGNPVQTCTFAFPDLDHEAFRESFFARTDAEKIAEDRQVDRISRLYILIVGGHEQFVRLVTAPSMSQGLPAVVASSITAD